MYSTKLRSKNQLFRKKLCTIHQRHLLIIWLHSRPNHTLITQKISTLQYASTQDKMGKFNQVPDYASTHPNSTIWYLVSNMILIKDTYAAYIVLPKARGRISCQYYFTKRMLDYSKVTPTPNGPILNIMQDPQNRGFLLRLNRNRRHFRKCTKCNTIVIETQ